VRRADNLTVWESEPSGTLTACTGIALPLSTKFAKVMPNHLTDTFLSEIKCDGVTNKFFVFNTYDLGDVTVSFSLCSVL
jgi:hypothetical protein